MNPTNRKGVIVGIFIIVAVAIIVTGILTLGGQKKSFVRAVQLYAVFKDVNGLSKGNNVWFSGVKIGTIKDIHFNDSAGVVVSMSIEEKVRQFIHADSKVKISSDGLIGNKILVISHGSATSPPVQDNMRLQVENTMSPEELMSTLQANNKNLLDITTDFKTISERLASGKGSVGKLLADDDIYNDLSSTMSKLKAAAGNATEISQGLASFTTELNKEGNLARDLASDTVIFSRLRASVEEINQAAARSNEIVTQLSRASAQINNPNAPVGSLLYDEAAAANLKGTLRNLEAATYKLDENMEALQHNFLFRGFFRKKARQERINNK